MQTQTIPSRPTLKSYWERLSRYWQSSNAPNNTNSFSNSSSPSGLLSRLQNSVFGNNNLSRNNSLRRSDYFPDNSSPDTNNDNQHVESQDMTCSSTNNMQLAPRDSVSRTIALELLQRLCFDKSGGPALPLPMDDIHCIYMILKHRWELIEKDPNLIPALCDLINRCLLTLVSDNEYQKALLQLCNTFLEQVLTLQSHDTQQLRCDIVNAMAKALSEENVYQSYRRNSQQEYDATLATLEALMISAYGKLSLDDTKDRLLRLYGPKLSE